MIRPLLLAAAAMLLGAAAPGAAAPAGHLSSTGGMIALHGNGRGALPCQVCHGMKFHGNASIGAPALAGQPEAATLKSLAAIASGKKGSNYVMKQIAISLTPPERSAVAAYFAGLPAVK